MSHGRRVWLIGGTQESALLARAIAQSHIPCIITVTTETARSLYLDATGSEGTVSSIEIWVGRLFAETLPAFLQQYQVSCILDASHPFAVEISELAIALSTREQVPYLRFERLPVGQQEEEKGGDQAQAKGAIVLSGFNELLDGEYLVGQRVLLTVGYRPLVQFRPWQQRSTLFARILPSVTALEAALAAGFTSDRLFAMRPPISAELETALWQQWQISLVVTKASGSPGGEDIKRRVASTVGVPLVVIERPAIAYPQVTSDPQVALNFCCHWIL